jgi:hypothetical protein
LLCGIEGNRGDLWNGLAVQACPRCGNDAAVDFEEHMIYCTGCPLTVQDTEMKFSLLIGIWNELRINRMKIIGFTSVANQRVGIPVEKITGIMELSTHKFAKCFISTGPSGVDGEENGWYVKEAYGEVWTMLESVDT